MSDRLIDDKIRWHELMIEQATMRIEWHRREIERLKGEP